MATYSTGITVTWNSQTFQEVQELSWTWGNGQPKDRLPESSTRWVENPGSVTVTCLGTTNITTANYGRVHGLAISGGDANLTCDALYESLSVTPELNGVTKYTVTFTIMD